MSMKVFWLEKTLEEMSQHEWESLCDGCGKCCLHTLEDEDDGELAFTNIACRLLNTETCRCSNYTNRTKFVPECTTLSLQKVDEFSWLPESCAYRLVAKGEPLPDWHHLNHGDSSRMHREGYSVKGKAVSEDYVDSDAYEEHIVRWV